MKKNDDHFLDEKNENKMKKMKTQMMIECKNNKIEISRLWLPEILLMIVPANLCQLLSELLCWLGPLHLPPLLPSCGEWYG